MLPNAKELIKLAKMCRKAGIKHYKGPDFEFTLADNLPTPELTKKAAKVAKDAGEDKIEGKQYTPEEMLFWSVTDPEGEQSQPSEN